MVAENYLVVRCCLEVSLKWVEIYLQNRNSLGHNCFPNIAVTFTTYSSILCKKPVIPSLSQKFCAPFFIGSLRSSETWEWFLVTLLLWLEFDPFVLYMFDSDHLSPEHPTLACHIVFWSSDMPNRSPSGLLTHSSFFLRCFLLSLLA